MYLITIHVTYAYNYVTFLSKYLIFSDQFMPILSSWAAHRQWELRGVQEGEETRGTKERGYRNIAQLYVQLNYLSMVTMTLGVV